MSVLLPLFDLGEADMVSVRSQARADLVGVGSEQVPPGVDVDLGEAIGARYCDAVDERYVLYFASGGENFVAA